MLLTLVILGVGITLVVPGTSGLGLILIIVAVVKHLLIG